MEELCFYDGYRAITDETIDILRDPDRQRQIARAQGIDALRDALAVDAHFLFRVREVPKALLSLQAQLRQMNPYILTLPVVQMILDMAAKAGHVPVPYAPFPKLPFWVELQGASVGDGITQFVAICALREPGHSDLIRVQLLTPELQQSKELFFHLDTGAWEYEQTGACSSQACGVAQHTYEGMPYRLTQQDSMEWVAKGCKCAEAGETWAQFVNILNHVLRHRKAPMTEHLLERVVPVPHTRPANRREKIENSAARKRSRPNIVTISLSGAVHVSQKTARRSNGQASTIEMGEKISVEGYWKVLIPGEGKPWKSLQLVRVEGYERAGTPAEQRTRYRVVE